MAFCRNCGKEIEDGTKFCPHCGAATSGSVSKEIDYDELKFSAALANSNKNRKTLISISVLCLLLLIGEMVFLVPIIFTSIENIIYFAAIFIGIIIITVVMMVRSIKHNGSVKFIAKFFKYNINADTTIGDLRKLKDTALIFIEFPALLLITSFLTFFGHIGSGDGVIENTIIRLKWLFAEPEFFSLINGSMACVGGYYSFITLIIGIPLVVSSYIIASRYTKFYRYFKSKLAPDAPEKTGGKVSDGEQQEREKLIDAADILRIGDEYDKIYNIYAERFSVKTGEMMTDGKFSLKSDSACAKYRSVKLAVTAGFLFVYIIGGIVWAVLASTHASQAVRPGSLGKIKLGYTTSQVESELGKPDSLSTPDLYTYTDMSELDNAESLEDAANAQIRQIIVFFGEDGANEINYNNGKTLNAFTKENLAYETELNGVKDGKIAVYKDGSIRIYIKPENQ